MFALKKDNPKRGAFEFTNDANAFIGFLVLIFIVLLAVETFVKNDERAQSIFGSDEQPAEIITSEGSVESRGGGFLASKDLRLGDTIINRDRVVVRQGPADSPVGFQDKRVKGRVVEGPVPAYGVNWWRVDYPETPDGWVESNQFTNKIALYTVVNIFPIIFGFLRPAFTILAIVLVILLVYIAFRRFDLKMLNKKKEELAAEQKILKQGHSGSSAGNHVVSQVTKDVDMEGGHEFEEAGDGLPIDNLPIGAPTEIPKTVDVHNKRWANIQSLIRSYNANDWKQAIIEADIILEEMLDKMQYKGNSIGDRLKKIESSDFITLNQAWEAHKFRNKIAHGHNYVLSKDEAERIIGLYEQVFKEFFYI